jgi:hypothetical protein
MQRMTDPHVYLRCGATSNSLEMSVLNSGVQNSSVDVINSNILGRVYKDVEFVRFKGESEEYFMNLQQKRLSYLHLFLTDSKGRRLGRLSDDGGGTAAGRESAAHQHVNQNQSTLGNLNFTAVVKVTILKVRDPRHLETKKFAPLLPAREAQSGIVTWAGYGNPKH